EAIKIGTAAGATLSGKIRERTYLGNLIQYAVELEDKTLMQVAEMNPQVIYEPSEEIVGLSITKNDTLILKN
ncbi:TOBE domain-containing protein, partial [Akkermansiaceae bacterium]|nr:TOBE domain-containing protein [Akkermansiaceae bacterium]